MCALTTFIPSNEATAISQKVEPWIETLNTTKAFQ